MGVFTSYLLLKFFDSNDDLTLDINGVLNVNQDPVGSKFYISRPIYHIAEPC